MADGASSRGRASSRVQPQRSRDEPERYGDFVCEDYVFARDRRHPSNTARSSVTIRSVLDQDELPLLEDPVPFELPSALAGFDLEHEYPIPHPQRLAFGRLADGTYAGFTDENHQVFRCGTETAYWCVLDEDPPHLRDGAAVVRGGAVLPKRRSYCHGPKWAIITLKEVRVVGGSSSRLNPTCVAGYWCNGPQELDHNMQRYRGQLNPQYLHTDIWSVQDGWDVLLPSACIRYPAHISVFKPGMCLASPDHVAMRGVNHVTRHDPIKIEVAFMLDAEATSFKHHLREGGVELDPPALGCLLWDARVPGDAGMSTCPPHPPYSLPACVIYSFPFLSLPLLLRIRLRCPREPSLCWFAAVWQVPRHWYISSLLG